MTSELYTCPNCGASLSLAQLRGTDCPFCKAVFPHHARAVEQAALVQQVMAQQMAAQGYAPPPPGTYVPHGYGVTPPPPVAGPSPYAPQLYAADAQRTAGKIVVIVVVCAVLGLAGVVVLGAAAWMFVR